jgi:glycosyltransferase involved in cell wall biosynthesis
MSKISIILPTYNGERHIRQSLDSILGQTFQDWELIIVNDCSIDHTGEIINQYAKDDCRIKIINNNKNEKLPTSLNIGFRHSSGEFLTWTSDDNLYRKNALEVMARELEQNKDVYMVCAGMINIDESGTELGLQPTGNPDALYLNNNIGACFMYRRKVLEDVGEYDADLFLVEDYDYWLRIMEYYGEIKRIFEPLYYYRRHKNSLTETKKMIINDQVKKLKNKHVLVLLDKVKNNPAMVCQLYVNYIGFMEETDQVDKNFFELLPGLEYNRRKLRGNKIIIFGAGNVGSYALKALGEKVVAFSDNDINKVGKYKEGLPIISFEEMRTMINIIEIVIAVSPLFIYELLLQLISNGINKFCIYQCADIPSLEGGNFLQ